MPIARRLLVVDDEPEYRAWLAEELTEAGYDVSVAGTAADALAVARDRFIHGALLDMRIPLTGDIVDERGGIALFRDLREINPTTTVVFLTAVADPEIIVAVIQSGAAGYIEKQRRPAEILAEVARRCGGPTDGSRLAITGPDGPLFQADEDVEDHVLCERLFPDDTGLYLTRLHGGLSRSSVYIVTPTRDAGLLPESVILKVGVRAELRSEISNYETYVKDYLKLACTMRGAAVSRSRGAIVYKIAGPGRVDQLEDLEHTVVRHPPEYTARVLDRLFNTTLARWLENRGAPEVLFPLVAYRPEGFDLQRLRSEVDKHFPGTGGRPALCWDDAAFSVENPLHVYESLDFGYQSRASQCITHGDLNARNVLVDDVGYPWLIDFPMVARRSALWDFVTLDESLRASLYRTVDPAQVRSLDERIRAGGRDFNATAGHADLVGLACAEIQRIALETFGRLNWPDYDSALLYLLLRRIAYPIKDRSLSKRERWLLEGHVLKNVLTVASSVASRLARESKRGSR